MNTQNITYKPTRNKKVSVFPKHYNIRIVFEDVQAKIKIHKMAQTLVNHMRIIKESRELIRDGKTMTWQQFQANEAKNTK